MRLTVFGATGGTGRALVDDAVGSGHDVTAVVRDPSRFGDRSGPVRVVRGDVLDAASLDGALDRADAVCSALGTRQRGPTTVYSDGVGNILAAMATAEVRRFVGLSAVPVGPRDRLPPVERRVVMPLLDRLFGEGYADMARMEALLRSSDRDWTVLRPPRLTNRPGTGRYRTAIDRPLARARSIARADLAAAMLDVLDNPATVRTAVTVAH
ncbi:MAG: NAD(P)-dependent oxidoreductase [Marmoricola sp.]